uniref:BNLF2a-like protein n=2 Tax=Lymphocryptovirus TaxID=10375 RepID=A2TJU2_9GAMA|nr:BNLF2a-like protein [Panine gammaherpesvirus 1]ABN04157.1 BNLF2a-like protein [Pongine gammaherpesvirus 2]
MVFVVHRALLDQQSAATGLPGPGEEQRLSHCPSTCEGDDLRLCLVLCCVLLGLLCLLLI